MGEAQGPEAAPGHARGKAAASRPGTHAPVGPAIIPMHSPTPVATRAPGLVLLFALLVIHHVALGVHAAALFASTEDQGGHDDPKGDQGAFFHGFALRWIQGVARDYNIGAILLNFGEKVTQI
jgi:hypothetical protein